MHTLTFDEIEALSNKYQIWMNVVAEDYGEPGYSLSPDSNGVLLGNWNNCPSHVTHVLEKQFDLEWLDEWTTDRDNQKAYRTQPDSHAWLPYYVEINGDIISGDECEEDPEWYITEYLLNDSDHVLYHNIEIDLTEHGFTLCDGDYENGWYHKKDVPSEILTKAEKEWPDCDFAFGDCTSEQFRVNFALYRRPKNWEV